MNKRGGLIIVAIIVVFTVLLVAIRMGNSNSKMKELNEQLTYTKDSLEDIGNRYNNLLNEYETIQDELEKTKEIYSYDFEFYLLLLLLRIRERKA